MQKTIVAMLLATAASAVFALASGATFLGAVLPGGLPLGNALTALGLCAAAGAAVRLSPPGTALRIVSLASLIASVAWLPASIALAGNIELNFGGWRGSAWLVLASQSYFLCSVHWLWRSSHRYLPCAGAPVQPNNSFKPKPLRGSA